jgi:hypothetical protein
LDRAKKLLLVAITGRGKQEMRSFMKARKLSARFDIGPDDDDDGSDEGK